MENRLPETLIECVRYFSDEDFCREFVCNMRWPEGVTCPTCEGKEVSFLSTRKIWKCRECKRQFSVRVGTIFEESPLPLSKWLIAYWLVTNAKNGISSCELARSMGIRQATAWFLLHRVRHSIQVGSLEKMTGTVEVDETYVGQKAKTMHFDKKKEKIKGRGVDGKAIVFGLLERGHKADKENGIARKISQVRATVVPNTKEETLIDQIKENVEEGTEVFTDAHKSYRALTAEGFKHEFVDHAVRYVEGRVYTNGIENFWGQLDRQMHGTYTQCDPRHLFRYTDELVFRFNHRDGTDLTRFLMAIQQTSGKRLTYEALTENGLKNMAPK